MIDIFDKVGNPPGEPMLSLGTVIDVNPTYFCADVLMADGQVFNNVQIMNIYGPGHAQDITWLHNLRGATVALGICGNVYAILGTLPQQQVEKEDPVSVPVTNPEFAGSDPNTYAKNQRRDYSFDRDTSFFPGDKVLRAETDTELSLWREGLVKLKAGSLAQFILGKFKDFARLIARTFQIYTDFGEIKSTHTEEGRVGLELKGGADFKEETHPQVDKWTVKVWVGDHPEEKDSRLYIRVNDADDAEYVTLMYDIKGNHTFETSQDDIQTIGNNREHTIIGDETITTSGDTTRSVTGDWTAQVTGTITIESDAEVKVKAPIINLN